jgi:transposase
MEKYTIKDFNKQFPNDDACLEWLKNTRYPDGMFCKVCGKVTNHSKLSNLPIYSCNRCGNHVHPMVGTIFERSRTPLTSWFYAIFLMSATRCGISAKQLQRELGVTYKTAWRMFREIRSLYHDTPRSMSGEVELDETYIGGRRRGKRGRGAGGKSTVFGIAQRKGDVSASVTVDLKSATVYPLIKERVLPDSMIYTDEFPTYDKLKTHGYNHKRVHHASKVWVVGDAHTNTIEGFWSVLKRGINGVYHAVSEKYLQSYINEYIFRYNHRQDEKPMFWTVLERI